MLMDSPVMQFLNKMADLLLLNILFLICCIPVVTIGPAITAMYAVSLRSVRYGDGYVVKEFIKGFRRNFWQSLIVWIGVLAIGVLFYIDMLFWMQSSLGMVSKVMMGVSSIFLFFFVITVLWLFPVLAKIENKLSVNIRNAAALAVGHFFPYTIIIVSLISFAVYMAVVNLAADVVMLLIGFALLSYVTSFLYYKVFAKYLDEEPLGEDDLLYYSKESEAGNKMGLDKEPASQADRHSY